MPRRVIYHDVDVADARCDFQRVGPKYRFNAQVFGPVLNKHRAFAQRPGKRWIDYQLCGRLWLCQRRNGGWAINIGGAEVAQRCGLDMRYRCQGEYG
ncbi:hypothetical protein OUHCRE12_24810 [Enterobacter kobei]